MRVLLAITSLEPGGAERVVVDLALGLARRGVEAAVTYLDGQGPLATYLAGSGVSVHPLALPHKAWPATLRSARLLRELRPDLVHAHIPRALFAMTTGAVVRRASVPLVYTEHNVQDVYPGWAAGLVRYCIPRLRHVIAVSALAIESFQARWGWPQGRSSVIPNGIHPERLAITRPPGAVRGELGVPEGVPLLVSVGSVARRKGHDVLVRALKRARAAGTGAACCIAGSLTREPAQARSVEHLVHALGLEGSVRLLGHRNDIADLMNAADAFVVPSRHEGFGIVALEALYLGKPVIATRTGALAEVLDEGRCGVLVPPEDEAALAEGIIRVLHAPAEARAMAKAGRQRVIEHFTVDAMVDRHIEVYEQVLAG